MVRYYVDPDSLNEVMLEIQQDILTSCEEEIKKKIRRRAYKTGRLMRSVENQNKDRSELEGKAEVGSDVYYAAYVDKIRRLFNADDTIDKAFDKLFEQE